MQQSISATKIRWKRAHCTLYSKNTASFADVFCITTLLLALVNSNTQCNGGIISNTVSFQSDLDKIVIIRTVQRNYASQGFCRILTYSTIMYCAYGCNSRQTITSGDGRKINNRQSLIECNKWTYVVGKYYLLFVCHKISILLFVNIPCSFAVGVIT